MVIQILSPKVLHLLSRHLTPVNTNRATKHSQLATSYSCQLHCVHQCSSHFSHWLIITNLRICNLLRLVIGLVRVPAVTSWLPLPLPAILLTIFTVTLGPHSSTTLHLHQPPPWLTNKNRTSWTSSSCFSTQTDVESRSICHMSLSGI